MEKKRYMEASRKNLVADPVHCSMNPANPGKPAGHIQTQWVQVVGLVEGGKGTHHLAVACCTEMVAERILMVVAGNKVFEDGACRAY